MWIPRRHFLPGGCPAFSLCRIHHADPCSPALHGETLPSTVLASPGETLSDLRKQNCHPRKSPTPTVPMASAGEGQCCARRVSRLGPRGSPVHLPAPSLSLAWTRGATHERLLFAPTQRLGKEAAQGAQDMPWEEAGGLRVAPRLPSLKWGAGEPGEVSRPVLPAQRTGAWVSPAPPGRLSPCLCSMGASWFLVKDTVRGTPELDSHLTS